MTITVKRYVHLYTSRWERGGEAGNTLQHPYYTGGPHNIHPKGRRGRGGERTMHAAFSVLLAGAQYVQPLPSRVRTLWYVRIILNILRPADLRVSAMNELSSKASAMRSSRSAHSSSWRQGKYSRSIMVCFAASPYCDHSSPPSLRLDGARETSP